MITKVTIDFLKDLAANNDRDWFAANKHRYEAAKEECTTFADALIKNLITIDKDIEGAKGKNCIYRIYRDVRFSKNKSPYHTHLGVHIVAGGKENEMHRSGYYVRIEPGQCILAGGAYAPPGPWINAIRQEIDYNTAEFKKIINSTGFKKYFGEIEGEKLKTAPKGYPKDHPEIELLKYKSYLAVHKLDDKQVIAKDFVAYATTVFKELYPFGEFLNRCSNSVS